MSSPATAEVTFKDAEGDDIRFFAEVQGTRGRVSLFHNGTFFKFLNQVVYSSKEDKIYINGHEATIELPKGQEGLAPQVEQVCRTGRVAYANVDAVDAEKELEKVREREAEDLEEALDGMDAEAVARAKAQLKKKQTAAYRKKVPKQTLDKLLELGVPENKAIRGLALGTGTTVETAMEWLDKHGDAPNANEPVSALQMPEWTLPLSEEEKLAKAKELQDQIEARKRERLEQEIQQQRELEKKRRIEGRGMQEVKDQHEQMKRLEAYEERRREKERDKAAKEQIRAKIAAEREAKGWAPLPGPTTDATMADAPQAAPSDPAPRPAPAPAPASTDDWNPMKYATPAAARPVIPSGAGMPRPGFDLTDARLQAAVAAVKARAEAVKVLGAYVGNLVASPLNAKFRSIKTTNNAFTKNVLGVPGAVDVLLLLGFRPTLDQEFLKITAIHLPTAAKLLDLLHA
ncbi:hypothetical protein DIPPA_34774 [Diplonema papillatum]|nr:hypothetical protein DIPPA_34774 [Diplonema papillatum]|eukprot:gene18187-28022_t